MGTIDAAKTKRVPPPDEQSVHTASDDHSMPGGPLVMRATAVPKTIERSPSKNGRANLLAASRSPSPAPTALPKTIDPAGRANDVGDGLLLTIKTLGNLLDDLERVRIMNANRIGALERDFGASLPALDVVQDHLAAVEHEAELELKRAWRKHPLRTWAEGYPGVGEKLIARLIAEIGDPGERPNVAKLWAYCGLGDPARKRRAGMTQEETFKLGNPKAKKVCWLIGEAFVKVNRGPGREQYDAARAKYADRVHEAACIRCGPSGKPAPPGSPWSLKHQHEAAKRYAAKMFLKDLWVVSRQERCEIHGKRAGGTSDGGHRPRDTHALPAPGTAPPSARAIPSQPAAVLT